MKDKMTFVLTSCGRTGLLNRTLESFFLMNTFKLDKYYLVEDSVDKKIYEAIKKKWSKKLNYFLTQKKKVK